MAALKDYYNPKSIRGMAEAIQKNYPDFKTEEFLIAVIPALKNKEMKDRVRWISQNLGKFLPEDFSDAADLLVRSIQSEKNPDGIQGFLAWPLTQFVEDFGLDNFSASMAALKEITKVMSAEFAIRPFLIKYEKESLALLKGWVKEDNVHVRRLVSEGTRPRLPWGQRLYHFQKSPQTCLGFLRELRHDPELYVRKSVANHLNDISKDHPEFLVKELKEWLKNDPQNAGVNWIVKHATRSLIKAGHPATLSLLGYKKIKIKAPKIFLSTGKLKFGSSLEISFSAQSHAAEKWLIDYVIHHQKANGGLKPKVFKWKVIRLEKGEKITLKKKHAFRKISTRKYYPGKHLVEIQVNGQSAGKKEFSLFF